MSLLLDALHRSRSGGERPDRSGRTAHADQVLATLGYAPQHQRPWAMRLAVMIVGAAALAALIFWGWPLLNTPQPQRAAARPSAAARPAQPVAPRSSAAASPQTTRRAPELIAREPATVPGRSSTGQSAPLSPPQTAVAPVPQRAPITPPPTAAVPTGQRAAASAPQTVAAPVPYPSVAPSAAPRSRAAAARGRLPESAAASTRPNGSFATPPRGSTGARGTAPRVDAPLPDDFRLALYYQRSGDFERALTHYRAVLERNELNAEAHNNLGLLYQQKGLAPEAIREFQRAIAINPRYSRAHNNLGVGWMREGNLDQAQAEFQAALSIDSSDTDALVNLALAQKGARQQEAAKTTLLRALTIDPGDAAAHYNLGLLYDEAGETARAVEHYRDFLAHAGVDHADLAPDVRARVDQLASHLR